MSIFQTATRKKLRFESQKGQLSVEDLWDLPLTSETGKANLDDIAREVNRQLKAIKEESFVTEAVSGNSSMELKLEILKSIIVVKKEEGAAAALARANALKKQEILGLIAKKQGEQLAGSSLEDLQKMAEAL